MLAIFLSLVGSIIATKLTSKNCPIIAKQVEVIFEMQKATIGRRLSPVSLQSEEARRSRLLMSELFLISPRRVRVTATQVHRQDIFKKILVFRETLFSGLLLEMKANKRELSFVAGAPVQRSFPHCSNLRAVKMGQRSLYGNTSYADLTTT